MKLPRYDLTNYTTTLPASGKVVKYRPYIVKEEKMLLQAAAGKDKQEMMDAAIQVIENACSVNVESLPMVDIEWLFLKLRIASVGSYIDVKAQIRCECSPEPKEVFDQVNLDLLDVRGLNLLEDSGFIKKVDKWVIMFDETRGCSIRFSCSKKQGTVEILQDTILEIYDNEEVYQVSEASKEEFEEWFDSLPSIYAEKLVQFYKSQPYISYTLKMRCPGCGKEHTKDIKGLDSFFG